MNKWQQILSNIGLDIPEGRVEVSIKCPLHDDRLPSLSINLDKGMWICHAGCGQGKLASLIEQITGSKFIDDFLPSLNIDLDGEFIDKK